MDYEAKFTKVKQAGWVKPDVMCSWIYLTTYPEPKKEQIWKFSKVNKNIAFDQNPFFLQMFIE